MGALVECDQPVAPGHEMTIDIVGVGPVVGIVRWAQAGKFGVQFTTSSTSPGSPRRKEEVSTRSRCCSPGTYKAAG
jgi:hypothetical protein